MAIAPNDYASRVRLRCRHRKCPFKGMYRRTVRKRPEEYTDAGRKRYCTCPGCYRIMKVDNYRQSKRERRKMRCTCGARVWKHTKGPGCREYAAQQAVAEINFVFMDALPIAADERRYFVVEDASW